MPQGEEMFNYHGYSGPCPKPSLPKVVPVWDDTLDEYEKAVLGGDVKGAAILRALLLEGLKAKQPTSNCAFCGKNPTECECSQPM
jgi:hypothetical protein